MIFLKGATCFGGKSSMQTKIIKRSEYGFSAHLIASMHRLRYKVFKDRLDWDVSVTGDMEIDTYDALCPTYIVVVNSENKVVGSVRLVSTTGPNMLADTFPILLAGQPAPRSPRLLESSRYCVDTTSTGEAGEHGLHKITYMLFAAMIEEAQFCGADGIVTVTDLRMERILRRAGWPLSRIGEPRQIGVTKAVAGLLEVSEEAAERIRRAGNLERAVLNQPALIAA
jgi:acyl homoserine lactone synthase